VLAADHRLRDSSSFRRTVRSGRRAGSRALVVHLRRHDAGESRAETGVEPTTSSGPLVGFVVGRTVGGAVVRNRVRRRLRHLVREFMTDLPPASEIVVRALPASAELSSAELRDELARCLQRVGASEPSAAGPVSGASS